ncbi:MAG: CotH kinase family protein [Bdellovibrionales bacterium]
MNVDFLYKADNGAAFDQVTAQRPNSVFDVKIGDKDFEFLKQLASLLEEPSNPRNRETIQKMVDLESVRRLARGIALVSHWDSVFNNFHLYRLKGGKKFYALAWDLDAIFDLTEHPFSPAYVDIAYNRLFGFAIQSDLNGHLTQIRNDLTTHFSGATMDAVALPQIERMRAAYQADPVLGGSGLQIETEYAKFRADALSWWNSLDQHLTSRGF